MKVVIEARGDVDPNAVIVSEDVARSIGIDANELVIIRTKYRAVIVRPCKAKIKPMLVVVGKNVASILNIRNIEIGEINRANIYHADKVSVEIIEPMKPSDKIVDGVRKRLVNKIVRRGVPIVLEMEGIKVRLRVDASVKGDMIYISDRTKIIVRRSCLSREDAIETIAATMIRLGYRVCRRAELRVGGRNLTVDVRAWKRINGSIFEVWVIYHEGVLGSNILDNIIGFIRGMPRAPNILIIYTRDCDRDAFEKACSRGIIIVRLDKDSIDKHVIEYSLLNIFNGISGAAIKAAGSGAGGVGIEAT